MGLRTWMKPRIQEWVMRAMNEHRPDTVGLAHGEGETELGAEKRERQRQIFAIADQNVERLERLLDLWQHETPA